MPLGLPPSPAQLAPSVLPIEGQSIHLAPLPIPAQVSQLVFPTMLASPAARVWKDYLVW